MKLWSSLLQLCAVAMLSCDPANACYKFSADTQDPCLDKECQFGAECKVRLDGKAAECVCPEKCTSYGDSKGSRPVCGSDGKDYPSVCELKRTACKEMRHITTKYQGSCGELNTNDTELYDTHAKEEVRQ